MADITPPRSPSPTIRYPPSEQEAALYYSGLPSRPKLVARSSTNEWSLTTGPWTVARRKELRPVGNHAIADVWEDNLALKVIAFLDSMLVKWTSVDVVRFAHVDEDDGPLDSVVVWVGVVPGSVSGDDGVFIATHCRKVLEENEIVDVEVEIRESVVTRSAGPRLLEPSDWWLDSIREIREPLTTTPCLPICAQSTPSGGGTGGFFIAEGGDTNRVLLVTARHIVFPPNGDNNEHFEHKDNNQPRHNVTLFSDAGLKHYLESIQKEIKDMTMEMEWTKEDITSHAEDDSDPDVGRRLERARSELDKKKKAIEALNALYRDVSTHWSAPDSRVVGHVILSPPIGVGTGRDGYTEDWAVIEIDPSKIDKSNFKGNVIDIGSFKTMIELITWMKSNIKSGPSFRDNFDSLHQLEGTIPEEEMRHPTALDHNGQPPRLATGLTVGAANNAFSYTRSYFDNNIAKTSKEWTILPRNMKSRHYGQHGPCRPFSVKGDSGSVIVDGIGRIGGLLTGSTGRLDEEWTDMTYATPISFLLKQMTENGLHKPHLNPVLAA